MNPSSTSKAHAPVRLFVVFVFAFLPLFVGLELSPPQSHGAAGPPATSNSDPLPAGAVSRFGTKRFRFLRDGAQSITWSPDGKWIAAGDGLKVHLWDAQTGRLVLVSPKERYLITFAISPNSEWLVGGSHRGLWILNLKTLVQRATEDLSNYEISSLRFSLDGKTLAAHDRNGVTHVHNTNGWVLARREKSAGGLFSPDGKQSVTSIYRRKAEAIKGDDPRLI